MGYAQAGFYVIGVDIKEQPNYPFTFVQGDALEFEIPEWVDFVHASPECQRYSCTKNFGHSLDGYGDDLERIRAKLVATGKPYVIENVPGAPMINPLVLHGDMFNLQVIRKRLFESNVFMLAPPVKPVRSKVPSNHMYNSFANGMTKICVAGKRFSRKDGAVAMGIDWMATQKELALSIPPAYTRYIGERILRHIGQEVDA